ncbi:MAG: cytochrome c [Acidobacteria bacterium]|nr:cytochrome c [Acidobacteriota bacterium]
MSRRLTSLIAAFVLLAPPVTRVEAQQRNGEAYSTTPEVVREVYDMRAAMAPIPLGEAEVKGRALFAQRCANCHGGTRQRPGPLLGQQTVEKLGETAIREKVRVGSAMMPGFQHALQQGQIDQIVAFLKTFTPRAQPQGGGAE